MQTHDDGVRNAAKRLLRAGRIDELRRLADAGDTHAAGQLARWLARTGRLDELLTRMAAGDRSARWAYSDWLVRGRRLPEAVEVLRPLAESGIPGARRRLARLLAGLGRVPEAMAELARAPHRWWSPSDDRRVESWLRSRDLWRPEHFEALRRRAAAGDPAAREQLSWVVLRWWPERTEAAVALLPDIGPSEWLQDRLVSSVRSWGYAAVRSTAVDLLAAPAAVAYRRTRAGLLLQQGRRAEAVALLRSLATAGDRLAEADLTRVLAARPPLREIRIGDHPDPLAPYAMAFSPDGATLAVWGHGSGAGRLALWDVATGARRSTQRLHSAYADGVLFEADGTVRELPDQRPRYPRYRSAPDGTVLAVGTRGRVRLCDAAGGATIRELATPGTGSMAFSADGALLATCGDDARVWEVATGRLVRTVATPTTAVAFRPDGAMLATADVVEATVRLWPFPG